MERANFISNQFCQTQERRNKLGATERLGFVSSRTLYIGEKPGPSEQIAVLLVRVQSVFLGFMLLTFSVLER